MTLTSKDVKTGSLVFFLTKSGTPAYCRVLKVSGSKIRVRGTHGGESWKPIGFFAGVISYERVRKAKKA